AGSPRRAASAEFYSCLDTCRQPHHPGGADGGSIQSNLSLASRNAANPVCARIVASRPPDTIFVGTHRTGGPVALDGVFGADGGERVPAAENCSERLEATVRYHFCPTNLCVHFDVSGIRMAQREAFLKAI